MSAQLAFWNRYYEAGDRLPWDMGKPTPVLAEALALAAPAGLTAGSAMVVPGCGYGHDAAGLAEQGYATTGLDLSPLALEGARQRYGTAVQWAQEDWFTTALGPWDAIFDHTCFVAMPPELREAFVDACAEHLKPGGFWLMVAFHDVEGRAVPPHPIALEESRRLAARRFDILHLAIATRSHPKRAGREHLLVARKPLNPR
jgi:SAM-dependent methyltransferase